MDHPTLRLLEELISRRSLTPDDAGCQALIAERLATLGFDCETLPFGPADFRRLQPLGGAQRRARGPDPGAGRPHRRGAHRPAGAVELSDPFVPTHPTASSTAAAPPT
jgi:succinyl-diaminopimelate desuccinylase